MSRDLELNSIDRYVKSSPRFVLEEHSHCEVPAGCGGGVWEWTADRHMAPNIGFRHCRVRATRDR